jgi:hypothetical protein
MAKLIHISIQCCGVSLGYGKAMGLDEPVTPVFPNSDFWYVYASSLVL